MDYRIIARKIIALKDADLKLRDRLVRSGQLGEGYHEAMQALHRRNAEALRVIIDDIGYPTMDKVGREASEAAWLIVQHSIGQPDFMRKCAALLENIEGAHRVDLAYLTDRIAVLEGRPQLYGTQFDWDENGKLSPQPVDNLARVDQRRKSIGLNALEEQTEMIRIRADKENQASPSDLSKRKLKYDAWRKKVGWIK